MLSGSSRSHQTDQVQVRVVRDDAAGGGVPEGHVELWSMREPGEVRYSLLEYYVIGAML